MYIKMSIASLKFLSEEMSRKLQNRERFADLDKTIDKYIGTDWKEFVKVSQQGYNRSLVYKDRFLEVYVITWATGQGSGIHDHAENGCWLKVLEGSLSETIFSHDFSVQERQELEEGMKGFMHNSIGLHGIYNVSGYTSVSLHLYSPSGHITKNFNQR